MVSDAHRALDDASAARDLGADLVEYRLDEFFAGGADARDLESEIAAACRLMSDSPLPCIATCRPTWEGGAYDGPEDARIALFEALGTLVPPKGHPPRYLDVELAAYTRSANIRQKVHLAVDHPLRGRDLAPSLVLSIHDFEGRPADLSRRILRARESEACRVIKVAYRARSVRDNLDLFDVLAGRDRPTIALGMGEFGLASRVLAPKFGGFLTFASLRAAEVTALGQPTIADLVGLYRFRSIGARTRVYAILGWPLGHTLSPAVHNAGFEAVGHDGVYLPMPVAGGEGASDLEATYASFKATLLALMEHDGLDFSGCSVTIPHKAALVRLARERGWSLDATAAACGAANTLVVERRPGGSTIGCRVLNSDGPAARECLEAAIGRIGGVRVSIIGAGGVARAIAAACGLAGAAVTVHARDAAQAARLVGTVGLQSGVGRLEAAAIEDLPRRGCDVVVNCTPVGMRGGADAGGLPVAIESITRGGATPLVFDTVYNPVQTTLLRAARAAGCRTIDGLEMFLRQAAIQFEAWTGTAAPSGLFDRVAREALG